MTINIRRAEREDAEMLFALARQYSTGREEIRFDDFLVALDNVLRYRDQETNVVFVATKGTEVVGYTLTTVSRLLHAPGLTAHIQEIVVDADSRSVGIGDTLMRANEIYCKSRGVRQISASTARIGSFFNHLGYKAVGEHFRKIIDLG